MSRILVKNDLSGEEQAVPYWISARGNLCWKIGEVLYVKMKSGYTSMLIDSEWQRSNMHTRAKTPQVTIEKARIPQAEKVRLVL